MRTKKLQGKQRICGTGQLEGHWQRKKIWTIPSIKTLISPNGSACEGFVGLSGSPSGHEKSLHRLVFLNHAMENGMSQSDIL